MSDQTNPAIVALRALKAMNLRVPIDEQSFERVAKELDYKFDPKDSMLIRDLADLSKLCTLGGFQVVIATGANAGALTAMKHGDDAVLRAARALSDLHADVCGVNREDCWKTYSGDFVTQAQAALKAAAPSPPTTVVKSVIGSMSHMLENVLVHTPMPGVSRDVVQQWRDDLRKTV